MQNRILIGAAAALLSGTIAAQAQSNDLCHHGGKTYSGGALVVFGGQAYRCDISNESPAPRWRTAGEAEANCVFGGQEYSRGAMIMADITPLVCSRGAWFEKRE